jgi:hypothetical protein
MTQPNLISENEDFQWIVFENGSEFARIGAKVFWKTGLKFVTVPSLVEAVSEHLFSECKSFSWNWFG